MSVDSSDGDAGDRSPNLPRGATPGAGGRYPKRSKPDRSQGHPGRRGGSPRKGGARRPGSIRLAPIGGNHFELIHPACVRETELDYEDGMELWRAGDPEGARDALRYALSACRDNLWIHTAL